MVNDKWKLADLLGDEKMAEHLFDNGVITVSREDMKYKVDVFLELGGIEGARIFEAPSFDTALICVTTDGRAVYDYDLMVEWLQREDGITALEAAEFIDTNTVRALSYAGPNAPVILQRFD